MGDHTTESCGEIFPEAKTLIQNQLKKTEFYKVGLWRKLNGKLNYKALNGKSEAQHLCDKEDISWEEVEMNLNYVLPFPITERTKPPLRYPLQSEDPMLKKFSLWQYESLLGLDDAEEQEAEPVAEVSEKKEELSIPLEVQRASHSCLKSLSNLYDSLAQLDILRSSQGTANVTKIKDIGWWVKQPTAGLSDTPRISHPAWRPCSNEGIIQEFAHRAVNVCAGGIVSALEEISTEGWPQLSLPSNRKEVTQSCMVQSAYCEW